MKKLALAVVVAALISIMGPGIVRAETLVIPAEDSISARPLPLRPAILPAPTAPERRAEPAVRTNRSLEAVLKSDAGASTSHRSDRGKAYNPIVIPLW